jgi:hypothetical protein
MRRVDIAHELQSFLQIFAVKAEAFPKNFHEVHDVEANRR